MFIGTIAPSFTLMRSFQACYRGMDARLNAHTSSGASLIRDRDAPIRHVLCEIIMHNTFCAQCAEPYLRLLRFQCC